QSTRTPPRSNTTSRTGDGGMDRRCATSAGIIHDHAAQTAIHERRAAKRAVQERHAAKKAVQRRHAAERTAQKRHAAKRALREALRDMRALGSVLAMDGEPAAHMDVLAAVPKVRISRSAPTAAPKVHEQTADATMALDRVAQRGDPLLDRRMRQEQPSEAAHVPAGDAERLH